MKDEHQNTIDVTITILNDSETKKERLWTRKKWQEMQKE